MPKKISQPVIVQVDRSMPSITKPEKKKISPVWFIVAVVIVALLGIIGLLYVKVQKASKELSSIKQQQVMPATDETSTLLGEIGKILVLPTNEDPTIATVSDLSKLAGQPFFEGAAVGDKVIIYSKSKKAILYRPSEKKVINIAPLTNDLPQDQAPAGNPEETAN